MRRRSAAVVVGVLGLAAGSVAVNVPHADAGPVATRGPAVRTVTLVTGDVVTVAGNVVSAEPGPGRAGMTFSILTSARGATVVPADAEPLLAADALDRRLFEVETLFNAGFDEATARPLIVTSKKNAKTAARQRIAGVAGLAAAAELPAVGGVAVRQARSAAAPSWSALKAAVTGAGKLWLDARRTPTLDTSVPQVGAPAAWAAGYTGTGVTVAVLDTGVDDTHPDLAGKVVARQNFMAEYEPDGDLVGHGTHVASTIAGGGARYRGVAPGATLLDGKVCVAVGCLDSAVIAGMTWAAEQGATVVNMSLGGQDDPDVVDPVEAAVQELTDTHGTLFVVSAGNADGVTRGVISSPGSSPAALTVGAVDGADAPAVFSRRGPGPHGTVKPDVVAPGVDIEAAKPGGGYHTLSGTSMAAPHVAGGAALLKQQHPNWSGATLRAALTGSAKADTRNPVADQGSGRLDLAAAIGQQLTASPPTVTFGEHRWPRADDEPGARTVTYHNHGAAPVTLDLRLDGPSTPFTVSPNTVTVPAGGAADVTVNSDTRALTTDGFLAGWLVATTGTQTVRTPVGVYAEPESYDVTFRHTDRAGNAPASYLVDVASIDDGPPAQAGHAGDAADRSPTLRLRKGTYRVTAGIATGATRTLLAQPSLVVDRPSTVDLDARVGRPVSISLSGAPDARQVHAHLGYPGYVMGAGSFAPLFLGRIGPDVTVDGFTTMIAGQWAKPDAAGGVADSPYVYSLLYPTRGRALNGYSRVVADRELAKVTAGVAATAANSTGARRIRTEARDIGGTFGPFLEMRLPFTRTEFYNTDPQVASAGDVWESVGDAFAWTNSEVYTAYKTGEERYNTGVFGPAAALVPYSTFAGVSRDGDVIGSYSAPFSDGNGRPGGSDPGQATTTLWRDGVEVPAIDDGFGYRVPAAEAAYRLRVEATRGAPFELSTNVRTDWTFRSSHGSGYLPLWTVLVSPPLDLTNRAPAGRAIAVPVRFVPQPGSGTGTIRQRTVEVSFDDGASWRAAPLRGDRATVTHPAGAGFVSLRVTGADSRGNTVHHTVIRAYRYG